MTLSSLSFVVSQLVVPCFVVMESLEKTLFSAVDLLVALLLPFSLLTRRTLSNARLSAQKRCSKLEAALKDEEAFSLRKRPCSLPLTLSDD